MNGNDCKQQSNRGLKSNRGFSLVELIIATAILAIVITAVCGFIVAGSKHYQWSNNEITIQQDAQMALNQLSDVMIDTNRAVSYYGCLDGDDDLGAAQSGLSDADIAVKLGGEIGDKYLALYNGEVNTDETTGVSTETVAVDSAGNELGNDKNYVFHFVKEEQVIEYYEKDITGGAVEENPSLDTWDGPYLFAEHVKDFSVDLSAFSDDETEDHIIVADGKRVIGLSLGFEMGGRTYDTSNNVTVRNRLAINSGEFLTVPKTKTVRIMTTKTSAILEPSDGLNLDEHFGPMVKGRNVTTDKVKWDFANASDHNPGTTITKNGDDYILKMAPGETHETIRLKVMSEATDAEGNEAEVKVYIYLKRVTGIVVRRVDPDSYDSTTRRYNTTIPNTIPLQRGEDFWVQTEAIGSHVGETCDGYHWDDPNNKCASWYSWIGDTWEAWKDRQCGNFTVTNRQSTSDLYGVYGNPGERNGSGEKKYIFANTASSPHGQGWLDLEKGLIHMSVADDAPKGVTFYVGANSGLANERHYDSNPQMYFPFTISPGDPIKLDRDLFYGKHANITGKFKDNTHAHFYVVAVRINTVPNDYANDAVFFYYTEGNNTIVNPDIFGLDWRNKYYISIQLLAHKGNSNNTGTISNAARNDYGSNRNFDFTTGMYKETSQFSVSAPYVGTIEPPVIEYTHPTTGVVYRGTQMKLNDIIGTNGQQQMIELYRSNVKIDGIDPTSGVCGALRFTGYRDGNRFLNINKNNDGNDSANYNPQINGLQVEQFDGNGSGSIPKLRITPNSSTYGEYRFVPTICYKNDRYSGDHANLYNSIFYKQDRSFTSQFNKLYLEVPESTIYFNVAPAKVNLNTWTACNGAIRKVNMYFPTPSENSFATYFRRNTPSVQECQAASLQFRMYYDNYASNVNASFSRITCEYIESEDKYRLEFFYQIDAWNKKVNVSAGTYVCKANGSDWTMEKAGWYDEFYNGKHTSSVSINDLINQRYQGNTTIANVALNGTSYTGYLYIPLPMDPDFTGNTALNFKKNDSSAAGQSNTTYKYKFKKQGGSVQDLSNITTKLTYDKNSGVYTLVWLDAKDGNREAAKFTYTEGQSGWIQK